ncbi:MAG: F0F1 ATP synthase subunit B [Thermodesulfovibrionia bacterium]|nr:F0F1 ATP synthase subunit B [Thermodesulfovibrionia bacterium]
MLDINRFFFWHLANFLILIWLLNIILFKPLFRIFEERSKLIDGSLESAKSLAKEKDELMAQIDAKLAKAKEEAKSINETFRKEGSEIHKQAMEAAQKDAEEMNRKAKTELESSVQKAKDGLRKEIEAFSGKIVEKMLGV